MEAALGHAVRNNTEAAYARSDLFEKWRAPMESGRASRAGRGSTTWTSCSRSSRWRMWRVRRPSPPTRATTCSRSAARSCRRGLTAYRGRGGFRTGHGPLIDSGGVRRLPTMRRATCDRPDDGDRRGVRRASRQARCFATRYRWHLGATSPMIARHAAASCCPRSVPACCWRQRSNTSRKRRKQ